MRKILAIALALTLAGCPLRVDVPGPEVCPREPTCQQCATEPLCGWLVADDAARGCYAARSIEAQLVRSPEGCPEGPLSRQPPETAP